MENTTSKIFITNLAKYNSGELAGEWFTLSDGIGALRKVLKRVLGRDEECLISDDEADFKISEYDNLDELVIFATLYDKLDEYEKIAVIYWLEFAELEKSEILEMMEQDNTMGDLVIYHASNETELGYEIAEHMEIPDHLQHYIDYGSIGHDEVCNGATQVGDYYIIQ